MLDYFQWAQEVDQDDQVFLFVINHGEEDTAVDLQTIQGTNLLTGESVAGELTMAAYNVMILRLNGDDADN